MCLLVILLKKLLLSDLSASSDLPTIIYEDNIGAIDLALNAKHNRRKHIDIAYHFVRERVQSGELIIIHCPTDQMTL